MTRLQRLGLWIAGWGGWTPCAHPGMVPATQLNEANDAAAAYAMAADRATALATSTKTSLSVAEQRTREAMERANALEARYTEVLRVHESLAGQVATIVAAKDAAETALRDHLQRQIDLKTELGQAADRAQAVADATQARYVELLRTHDQLAKQVTDLVDQRDRALDDFRSYAQQRWEIRPDLQARAKYLVTGWKKHGYLDGEYKRHQVYADLLKEFPGVRKRDLSLAIEMALRAVD